jgi:hypothetical protein
MKGLTFVLTVDMGKRLIAKGLMAEPEVQRVLKEGRLLIIAGTTNLHVAREALRVIGDETEVDWSGFHRGVTVAAGTKIQTGSAVFDLLIDHGKASFNQTVFDVAPTLTASDLIMKGANALYMPAGEAGVVIGHPHGGTLMPIIAAHVGRRVPVILPVGLEKRVSRPISELAAFADDPCTDGVRLCPAPGRTYTEMDALRILTGAEDAQLIAAGGILGAEGGVYVSVRGSEESIKRTKELLAELRDKA